MCHVVELWPKRAGSKVKAGCPQRKAISAVPSSLNMKMSSSSDLKKKKKASTKHAVASHISSFSFSGDFKDR